MICKWYHVWNALPNKWLTFDEIIKVVEKRYPTLTDVEEALKEMIDGGKAIQSKQIKGVTKFYWKL